MNEKANIEKGSNDNHNCPKCGGLTYSNFFADFKLSKCAICGLLHHLGSSKESLKKQILGDKYVNPIRVSN